jgi:hypothetical protein
MPYLYSSLSSTHFIILTRKYEFMMMVRLYYLEFLGDVGEQLHDWDDEKKWRRQLSVEVRTGSSRTHFGPSTRRGGEDLREPPKADADEGPGEGEC